MMSIGYIKGSTIDQQIWAIVQAIQSDKTIKAEEVDVELLKFARTVKTTCEIIEMTSITRIENSR